MSWRTGAKIFWQLWPNIKAIEPKGEFRDEFVKEILRVFLKYDCDPGDFRDMDPDLDRLLKEVDPVIE